MRAAEFEGSSLVGIGLGAAESQLRCRWWFRLVSATVGTVAADASFDRRPPIGRSRRRSFVHSQAAPLTSTLTDMLLMLALLPVVWGAPNVLLRISQSGLQQSEQYFRHLIDREIPRLRVPSFTETFNEGPGHGKVTVTKVIVKHFTSPLIKFRPSADGLLRLRTAWGEAEADANFDATYKVLSIVPVPFGGRISAKAQGMMSNVAVRVDVVNGKPALSVVECTAKIETFELSLSGGFVARVVDLFKGALSRRISEALEHAFCKGVEKKFVDFFGDRLAAILTDISLSKNPNVLLTYSLQQVKVSEEKVDLFAEAAIEWDGVRLTPSSTAGNDSFPVGRVSNSSRMIDLYIKDSVFQSALSGAHYSGFFGKDVGENNTFLETTCEGLCIGAFAPVLHRTYPNRHLMLHVSTTDAPVVRLAAHRAIVAATGNIAAYLLPRMSNDEPLVRANISADIEMNLAARKNSLTGWVEIENATMVVTGSQVGRFDETTLGFIVDLTVPFLEDATDTYLRRGVHLPAPFDWRYDNSKLTIVGDSARFESDIIVFI
uniref:Uncharacterized protein n=1 Tax=Plectus sambesii TaxID=2011161 RepID=A0A914UTA0_9BILA